MDALPPLIRVTDKALICTWRGCPKKWKRPAELNDDNFQYLWNHATNHQHPRKWLPDHKQRPSKWSDPKP